MPDEDHKITTIDKPRCSRCGKFKPADELNGYDPLAPVGHKFKSAYCRRLSECHSLESKKALDDISDHLD